MLMQLAAREVGSSNLSDRCQQSRLATRTCAHVQPLLIRFADLSICKSQRYELTSFVLDDGTMLCHGRDSHRLSRQHSDGQFRPQSWTSVIDRQQFLNLTPTRTRGKDRARGSVICLEKVAHLGEISPKAVGIRAYDPLGMTATDGKCLHGRIGYAKRIRPLLLVMLADLSQDRIDETRAALGTAWLSDLSCQGARSVNGRVCRNTHIQELMRSHEQDVAQLCLNLRQWS